jgi:GR25 family glycosyltransferase involved in LPS biosynthesis
VQCGVGCGADLCVAVAASLRVTQCSVLSCKTNVVCLSEPSAQTYTHTHTHTHTHMASTANPWHAWSGRVQDLPAVYINLDRSVDRREYAEDRWRKHLPQLARFSAVAITKEQIRTDVRVSPLVRKRVVFRDGRPAHQDINTVGAIGCTLSHLAVWRQQVADGTPLLVVLEDACTFLPSRDCVAIENAFKTAPRTLWTPTTVWRMNSQQSTWVHEKVQGAHNWYRHTLHGTAMYIVPLEAARLLAARALPVEFHVDRYMRVMSQEGSVPCVHTPAVAVGKPLVGKVAASTVVHDVPQIELLRTSNLQVPIAALVVEVVVIGLCAALLMLAVRSRSA